MIPEAVQIYSFCLGLRFISLGSEKQCSVIVMHIRTMVSVSRGSEGGRKDPLPLDIPFPRHGNRDLQCLFVRR